MKLAGMPKSSDQSQLLDLELVAGKTFRRTVRWEAPALVSKAITAISRAAPVRITAVAHAMVDGWNAAVVGAQGMRDINAAEYPPGENDWHRTTIIDVDTVEFNDVSSADFAAWMSGGFLVYHEPQSLSGCDARLVVKTATGPDGTELVRLDVSGGGIVLNDTTKTITFTFPATDTEAYDWDSGVWELEIEDGTGFVTGLYHGTITVVPEAAT